MTKIRVKYFGPIKEGFSEQLEDGTVNEWMDVKKVTVFIGDQASGKSTVAKLISTLSWLEKDMVRGMSTPEDVNTFKRFQRMLRYQRIDGYLNPESEIEYEGSAVRFSFNGSGLDVEWLLQSDYMMPKIMYVPAERNFLAVVDRADKLKNLPSPLFTFLDEYDSARNLYATGIDMPIGNIRFEYDKKNKLAHIVDKDGEYELRLSEAASGYQSTVPLYLVTKYLAESLGKEKDAGIKELSLEEQRKQDKIKTKIKNDKKLTIMQRDLRMRLLEAQPSSFINVVEEPEQNLFPTSQKSILNELLKYANHTEGNKLIMTTHSPYVITYLSIAIQAAYLKNLIVEKDRRELLKKLFSILPETAHVAADDVQVYELNVETGCISRLPNPYGIPSDKNYLNQFIREGNIIFDSLLELEEQL